MKYLIAHLILYPLCYRNFRFRVRGKLPDKPHWADSKLAVWGYLYRDEKKYL